MFNEIIRLIEAGDLRKLEDYCATERYLEYYRKHEDLSKETEPQGAESSPLHPGLIEPYRKLIAALYQKDDAVVKEIRGSKGIIQLGAFVMCLVSTQPQSVINFFLKYFDLYELLPIKYFQYLILSNDKEKFIYLTNLKSVPADVIYYAVQQKKLDYVSILLDGGLSPDTCGIIEDSKGNRVSVSLLIVAIRNHDIPMIRLLLTAGASTKSLEIKERIGSSRTPASIDVAVEEGVLEIIRMLISSQETLFSALSSSLRQNKFALFSQLAEENNVSQMPTLRGELLEVAMAAGNEAATKYLSQDGSNLPFYEINLRIKLLKQTISSGYIAGIEYLLQDKPNLALYEKRENGSSDSLLERLLQSRQLTNSEKYDIAVNFLKLGANVNAVVEGEGEYHPVLHACAYYGDARLLKLFEKQEVCFNTVGTLGRTVLHSAFSGRNISTIRYLLAKGITPSVTKYGEDELSIALSGFGYSYPHQGSLRETLLIALSLSPNINRSFPELVCHHDSEVKVFGTRNAISRLLSLPIDEYMVRVFLESGANPNIANSTVEASQIKEPIEILAHKRDDEKPGFKIRLLHIAGMLIDKGAEVTSLRKNFKSFGWFDRYIAALGEQKKGNYKEAIMKLRSGDYTFDSPIVGCVDQRDYCFIWCRLGVLQTLAGDYEKAFVCLQNARTPSKCTPLSYDTNGCVISVANELVELFYTWNEALELEKPGVIASEAYSNLFELIQSLPHDELTPNSHFKLAELYMKFDDLNFSQRQELLIIHFSHVICGDKKDTAVVYLKNLQTPENQFKYELDKVIVNTEISSDQRRNILITMLNQSSNLLKSIGVKFILTHRMYNDRELSYVVKVIRHTAITGLMNGVDTFLSSGQRKEAVDLLQEAKDDSLFNMLKKNYVWKKTTKAADKIEEKLKQISSLPVLRT